MWIGTIKAHLGFWWWNCIINLRYLPWNPPIPSIVITLFPVWILFPFLIPQDTKPSPLPDAPGILPAEADEFQPEKHLIPCRHFLCPHECILLIAPFRYPLIRICFRLSPIVGYENWGNRQMPFCNFPCPRCLEAFGFFILLLGAWRCTIGLCQLLPTWDIIWK